MAKHRPSAAILLVRALFGDPLEALQRQRQPTSQSPDSSAVSLCGVRRVSVLSEPLHAVQTSVPVLCTGGHFDSGRGIHH